MIRYLYSRLLGRRVGEIRYLKDSPFRVGNYWGFLPFPDPRQDWKYCVREQVWDGYRWGHSRDLTVDRETLITTVTLSNAANEYGNVAARKSA